jgi:hypothetical protein
VSPTTRRIVAACTALITVVAAAAWTLVAGWGWLNGFAQHLGRDVPLSEAGAPRPGGGQHVELYYNILIAALILAVGGLAALLVLVPRPSFRRRAWIYVGFLLIVLPASLYNFSQEDTVLAPTYQFALNFISIFLTATVAIWIANLPAEAADVRVLKAMCVFLLWVPCIAQILFNLIWFLNQINVLSLKETRVSWTILIGLASVASAIIAALNYRREIQKATTPAPPSRIIVP